MPLPAVIEETNLVEFTDRGRVHQLHSEAFAAWNAMQAQAASDGVNLILISAFRSIARQQAIIDAKRAKGISDQEIFRVNAQPGFSEHHSGLAIDLGADDCQTLEESFEETDAFQWLMKRAREFSFYLSYPRNNPYGITYEPWHWRFKK
ncbi:M15 family metallopeptidase [Cerasicoccus frondis]|uniref:M15 family metallopeptidase n=1 Tax=Cerasicoccus frondis TaxID=490090 RepID=UPI00285286E5|nr:M15 family metallopeptidase [Cerasicoccus frondis]